MNQAIIDLAQSSGFEVDKDHKIYKLILNETTDYIDVTDEVTKLINLAGIVAEVQKLPEIDESQYKIKLDKRDLFDFVRNAIKSAMTTDENSHQQARLWSDATDATVECLSKLYEKPTAPDNFEEIRFISDNVEAAYLLDHFKNHTHASEHVAMLTGLQGIYNQLNAQGLYRKVQP